MNDIKPMLLNKYMYTFAYIHIDYIGIYTIFFMKNVLCLIIQMIFMILSPNNLRSAHFSVRPHTYMKYFLYFFVVFFPLSFQTMPNLIFSQVDRKWVSPSDLLWMRATPFLFPLTIMTHRISFLNMPSPCGSNQNTPRHLTIQSWIPPSQHS